MIVNRMPTAINNKILPGFTYTGNYQVVDDGDAGWRIKFLSSGTLKLKRRAIIDVFLVGGGQSGQAWEYHSYGFDIGDCMGGKGGNGGETKTYKEIILSVGVNYQIVVGPGGASVPVTNTSSSSIFGPLNAGGSTYAFGYTANGANYQHRGNYGGESGFYGRNNGSAEKQWYPKNGGSDGKYTDLLGVSYNLGTTREFGEPNGDLYAGGGGGAPGGKDYSHRGLGGSGGGGAAANNDNSAVSGTANTGGGGGGGFNRYGDSTHPVRKRPSGAGGSGIVIIRNHRA